MLLGPQAVHRPGQADHSSPSWWQVPGLPLPCLLPSIQTWISLPSKISSGKVVSLCPPFLPQKHFKTLMSVVTGEKTSYIKGKNLTALDVELEHLTAWLK